MLRLLLTLAFVPSAEAALLDSLEAAVAPQGAVAVGARWERKWPFLPEAIQERFGRDAQQSALAATPRGPNETFTFALLGDVEPGRFWFTRIIPPRRDAFRRHMADINARDHDFVLQLGDFVSRGKEKNYARFFHQFKELVQKPFFAIIGNHDRRRTHPTAPAERDLYEATFAGAPAGSGAQDFYFDHGGYRFIGLDSADGRLRAAQLAWLDAVLSTERRTIVAMHIPPAYLKGKWSRADKAAEDFAGEKVNSKNGVGYFSEGAEAFGELASRRGVERVYVGHIHALAHAEYKGVRYVLSGGGGSPLYRYPGSEGEKIAHYILVEAGPDGLRETIVPLRGGERAFADAGR